MAEVHPVDEVPPLSPLLGSGILLATVAAVLLNLLFDGRGST